MPVDFVLRTEALLLCYCVVVFHPRQQEVSRLLHFYVDYLKQPNQQCRNANGSHDGCVVIQQGLSAPLHPDVELLCQKVVVVVSAVVRQLVLDAGPRGAWVAAAEGHSIHQELPINVALETAATEQKVWGLQIWYQQQIVSVTFTKMYNASLLQCRLLQCNKRTMGIYLQLENLLTAGKLNFSFAVFLKCGISTVSHMVLGTVCARCGFRVRGGVAFLGIFALKILKTISELVYLGGILMEATALEILCFTTLGLIFQHKRSLRESLIQEQRCMPQEPPEFVRWHFITVPHVQRLVRRMF